jgi:hypothetical protein
LRVVEEAAVELCKLSVHLRKCGALRCKRGKSKFSLHVLPQQVFNNANSQIGLPDLASGLESGIEEGYSCADYCSGMIKFSFASDSILCEFFSPDRIRELDSDL